MDAPQFLVTPATLEAGFTQSELSLMDECTLKWQYRYNNLMSKDLFDLNLFVGSAWHNFQENWRRSKGEYPADSFTPPELKAGTLRDSEFEQKLEYWSEILPAYQLTYIKLYKGEEKENYFVIEE